MSDLDIKINALRKRVEAIEARQRANGIHDGDCPVLLRAQAQAQSSMYIYPVDCTCWLSNDAKDNG